MRDSVRAAQRYCHAVGTVPPLIVGLRLVTVREGRFEGDSEPATVLLGYGPRRFFRSGGESSLLASFMSGPAQYERVRTVFDPLATITNSSDWLAKLAPDQFNAIVRALKKLLMLPEGTDPVRKSTGNGSETEIVFTMDGIDVPLSALSEGYRMIIATSVDVMRERLRHWTDLESAEGAPQHFYVRAREQPPDRELRDLAPQEVGHWPCDCGAQRGCGRAPSASRNEAN